MKKKIFKGNLSEFLLIIFEGILAAIGGILISEKNWFPGILSFLSFFIVGFMLSKRKQNTILYGTSENPGPASNFPEGTIYMKYKDNSPKIY